MREIRVEAPTVADYLAWEKVDESDFGFRVRDKKTGDIYRCAIAWNGKANWFLQVDSEDSQPASAS